MPDVDLIDVLRIAIRRWYVAFPLGILTAVGSLFVYSSVELTYKSTGSVLLFAPRVPNVEENRLLGFNSLQVRRRSCPRSSGNGRPGFASPIRARRRPTSSASTPSTRRH